MTRPRLAVGALVAHSLEGLVQRHDPQTTASPQPRSCRRGHERRAFSILPFAEDTLHIAWDAFKDYRGDGHKGAILHSGGEDGVFLCKIKSVVERGVLRLRTLAHNDVKLEERIQYVDARSLQVGLREGTHFDNLGGTTLVTIFELGMYAL